VNDVAPNECDGPRKPAKKPALISLDFASSNDPFVLDSGVRETMRGMSLSAMAVSRALCRIYASGCYGELGYKSMGAYIDKLAEETGHSRAIFCRRANTGEIALKCRNELERHIESLLAEAMRAKAENQRLRGHLFYDGKEANKFDKAYNRELKALRGK
jgi:hypothetical protein